MFTGQPGYRKVSPVSPHASNTIATIGEPAASVAPPPVLVGRLEIQTQRQLDLSIGAQTDLVGYGLVENAEIRPRGCSRKSLAGLQAGPGRPRNSLRQAKISGVGEIGVIKDVVELGAKFHIARLTESEPLAQSNVALPEPRPGEAVTRRIAESPWRR